MNLRTSCFFLGWSIAIAVACSGSVATTDGDSNGTGGGSTGSGSGNTGSGASGSSGTATGGSGTGSTSSTGSGMAAPCASSADCTLHSDCCNCLALGPGEQPPACDIPTCLVDACTSIGGITPDSSALCSGGQCIVGFDCNGSDVVCDSPPPACPPGQVPTADMCWGQCVDVEQCREVTSCADCEASQVCVFYAGWVTTWRCVEVPPACAQDRSCACLGSVVCTEGYDLCTDGTAPNQVGCECPAC